jgi:hypothetical protein
MLPHTSLEPQDDPAFLAVVDRLVVSLVRRDWPEEVYLIHIDNWFDHKWLRFSGYGIIAFPGGYPWIVTAKEEHRQEQLTFPPFSPNRVVAQYFFRRITRTMYEEQAPVHSIHRQKRQHSSRNLHRRVVDFASSGLFVWYSSGSAANRRGSLLVYSTRNGDVAAWYAAFGDRQGWRLDQVKGIDRQAVRRLLEDVGPDAGT